MKRLLALTTILLTFTAAVAQEKKETYRIKEGSDISKALPYSHRFQYDTFRDGKAIFRNGRISKAKFNYNLVHGEVMFIAPNKDTLLLTDSDYIRFVTIDSASYYFYPKHGHVEVTSDFGRVRLARKLFLVQMGSEKYASYDQYSSTSAISSYSSFQNSIGGFQTLEGRDKVIFRRREVYYLIDKNDQLLLVNRGSLMKLFPSQKSEINRFLKDNLINLENEPDLKRTLEFCSTL